VALCDRGIDLHDCVALAPTIHELDEITLWLQQQDANPDWPAHVRLRSRTCSGGSGMGYRRVTAPLALATGEELTRAMVGIGMNFAATAMQSPNIEDTLLAASIEGMEHDDLRMLSVLVTWLGLHHPRINADRLIRAASSLESARVRAFWAAVAQWLSKDRRLTRLISLHDGPRVDVLRVGTDFQAHRKGEDLRFCDTALRVPAGVLRDRAEDVLSPAELATRHRAYRHRVLMGPNYRADMWAALESDPSLSPAELARRTYGSFATAWQVKQDFDPLVA
jgi:hypothetical protein